MGLDTYYDKISFIVMAITKLLKKKTPFSLNGISRMA